MVAHFCFSNFGPCRGFLNEISLLKSFTTSDFQFAVVSPVDNQDRIKAESGAARNDTYLSLIVELDSVATAAIAGEN